MARIRILHVLSGLGLGGTEKTAQLLAMHLTGQGYEVAVAADADGPRGPLLRRAGVPTHICPVGDALARFQPHIVHIHRAGWPEPRIMRPIRLYAPQGWVETNVFGRYDPTPNGQAVDRILFVSEFCRRRYGAVHGLDVSTPRYGVLANPVDVAAYAAPRTPESFAQPVIGRLSRADPGKWSPLALEMLPPLLERLGERCNQFRYRIIGGTSEARRWVTGHGLESVVEWLPPVAGETGLASFFGSLALLAHANDTGETFGMAIAEAMAAGLPVVTHSCPGLKDNAQLDLVRHGHNGLVASTVSEYAAAVAWLLDHPREAAAMGQAGREMAQAFAVERVGRQLEGIYEELLAAAPASGYVPGHGRSALPVPVHP